MRDLNEKIYEVAAAAAPPAEFFREPELQGEENDVLLHDFVETSAWVPRALKEWFLTLYTFDSMDYEGLGFPVQEDLRKFAAMEPKVDLDSLRGRDPMKGLVG